jgi:hypothetical protein
MPTAVARKITPTGDVAAMKSASSLRRKRLATDAAAQELYDPANASRGRTHTTDIVLRDAFSASH